MIDPDEPAGGPPPDQVDAMMARVMNGAVSIVDLASQDAETRLTDAEWDAVRIGVDAGFHATISLLIETGHLPWRIRG